MSNVNLELLIAQWVVKKGWSIILIPKFHYVGVLGTTNFHGLS